MASCLLVVAAVGSVATTRSGGRTRVLVVENDPVRRLTVAGWLRSMPGVTVVAVASAGQAMASGQARGCHLCLLRHELGGVDGLTLGAMIRQVNADARLVLLGSGPSPHLAGLAREHGFAAVVDGTPDREQVEGWLGACRF
jgi:CheY-like chemotaxis protein